MKMILKISREKKGKDQEKKMNPKKNPRMMVSITMKSFLEILQILYCI